MRPILTLLLVLLLNASFYKGSTPTANTQYGAGFRTFYSHYLLSPRYKERLLSFGYDSVETVVAERILSLITVSYGESDGSSCEYTSTDNHININWEELFNMDMSYETVLAHEFSHAIGSRQEDNTKDKWLRLNPYEQFQLKVRNKLTGRRNLTMEELLIVEHDSRPCEAKADLDAFRFELFRDKLYDTSMDSFTLKTLYKAKYRYENDYIITRLRRNFSEDDIIYLMNNIP